MLLDNLTLIENLAVKFMRSLTKIHLRFYQVKETVKKCWVVNSPQRELKNSEIYFSRKRFNFVRTRRRIPIKEVVTSVEKRLRNLPSDEEYNILGKGKGILLKNPCTLYQKSRKIVENIQKFVHLVVRERRTFFFLVPRQQS